VIASGGVSSMRDAQSLARLANVSGCVVGKALLERRFRFDANVAEAPLAPRVIPCLDVDAGRVKKGVQFLALRDAGEPAELAAQYEAEGADEIVMLDVSATTEGRGAAFETVRRVADALFIPLTVGGGVRTVADFRALLRAGADRVAINSAAVQRPELLRECAEEFGVQAVVLACDAKDGRVMIAGGRVGTELEAVDWCKRAEELGAGEILLTSIDRDGTQSGFDTALLRRISGVLRIGVIASGGAGTLDHFREALEDGGASAVLAASLFHDKMLTIGDVKRSLAAGGIRVRGESCS
jgi:cyclase